MQSVNACAGVTAGAAPVNDAVRHSVPVSNLLAVQAVTATQSVDAGPVNDSLAPSMIQGLQDRAHAGFQATAQVVREHVDLARQSANERVKVAKAGKKLLDEGGDSVAQMVVAKKASLVASEMDLSVADSVHGAIVKLDDSVAQLRKTELSEGRHFSPIEHEASFLAGDHERHAATCRRIAQMLATPASSAAMSAEECDALAIVKAKEGCATVMSHTSDGLARIKQRTLGGASQSDDPVVSSEIDQAPTLLQTGLGWFTEVSSTSYDDKLWNGFQKLQQAANDRVETAKNGKRLLESGGDNVEQVMLAKMACRDAADMDRVVAEKVQNAITLFDDSAAKLRCCSKTLLALEGAAAHNSLAQLAAEHETRANTYRQIAEMLKQPLATVEMNLAEWDALSLVKLKDGSLGALGALQSRTNEGFEALKSLAYPSVSSEIQRDCQRRRTVCA